MKPANVYSGTMKISHTTAKGVSHLRHGTLCKSSGCLRGSIKAEIPGKMKVGNSRSVPHHRYVIGLTFKSVRPKKAVARTPWIATSFIG